ncbi:hypothetical protein ACHQM5_016114 [Ranunculus cassubicifolius]
MANFSRILNGVNLIAKEISKQHSPQHLNPSTILKSLLVSATDLAGLTKGPIIHHSINPNSPSSIPKQSILYFDNNHPITKPEINGLDQSLNPNSSIHEEELVRVEESLETVSVPIVPVLQRRQLHVSWWW